jgi:hypothetical protein
MTLRLPKAVLIGLAALLLVGIGVAGAMVLGGGDDSGDKAAATAPSEKLCDPDPDNPSPAIPEDDIPCDQVEGGSGSTGASETPTEDQDQVNVRIADQMATVGGGKPLAKICEGIALGGRVQAEEEFRKTLGPLVIQQGGDVSEVMDLLLDRC